MVYRIFVEKKPGLDKEARDLLHEANELLQISSRMNSDPGKITGRTDPDQVSCIIIDKQGTVLCMQHHMPCMMHRFIMTDDRRLIQVDVR